MGFGIERYQQSLWAGKQDSDPKVLRQKTFIWLSTFIRFLPVTVHRQTQTYIHLSVHPSLSLWANSLWVLLSSCARFGKRIVRQTQRTERRIGMNSLSGQICCYHSGVCLSPSATCSSQIHRPSMVVVIKPPGSANESLILGSARE